MKGTKIVVILLLIVIISFSLPVLLFPGNASIEEIKVVDLSKNNKLLEDELSRISYTPKPDKSYYRMFYTINIKSNLPFVFKPALRVSSNSAKVIGFTVPYSSYTNINYLALPFEKSQPAKISPFGRYKGTFMFIVETSKTNPDELAKSFSFSLLNLKYTKDLSNSNFEELTACLLPKIRVKFDQHLTVKEE
ncbi:MAG: hypothetical protein KBH94_05530 [Caldisericia bacterium]|nr:hypothetical protein [Caldisericia bacterium]